MIEQRTRKPKPTNYETRIQIRLSQQLYEDLKAYAGDKHMSKVVRRIIENYLYENGKIVQREELKRKKFMHKDEEEEKIELKIEGAPEPNGKEVVEIIKREQDIEQRTRDLKTKNSFDLFID